MGKEATAYIFSFDSKSGVFTLTSTKDQLTIDSKHKKYEWLKGQEAGRVIKISATGRWNSSRDYDNLYQSIKPKKKVLKKSKTSKTNTDKAGEYCFSFIENEFVLTDQNGVEIKITSKHKKFEWLQSQDSGRVIKISEKGRWNSSKDYDGLYEKVKSSKKKPTKPKTQKSKPAGVMPSNLKLHELTALKETIFHLKDKLQKREKEWRGLLKAKKYDKNVIIQLKQLHNEQKKEIQLLKTKNTSLKNEIQLLKQKSQPAKPKATKKVEKIVARKHWKIKFIATESYTYGGSKTKRECTIKLQTEKLKETPTKSYAKALLRQHIANKVRKYPIRSIWGISDSGLLIARDYKLTNITILSVEEC